MNILFANYGDFTTNSLNHIAGFARALADAGHDCVVAVPDGKETLAAIPSPSFGAATFAEVLAQPACFKDGRSADVIHAWTPREGIRRFVLAHQRATPARLIVHLEDNEEFLVSSYMDRPAGELRGLLDEEFPKVLPAGLPHPVRFRNLLRLADAVTVIVDTLTQFVPPGKPVLQLPPGVDFDLYRPQVADPGLRSAIGAHADEKLIVFTGSNTFANESEIRDLYLAVHTLNQRGRATRLVRTGFNSPALIASLPENWRDWTTDLGFIDKHRLPALIALADVLVQPGHPGPFNDLRLPSKLPEFLAAGRPVVLPASNVGRELRDGEEALVLPAGTPEAIADACERIFADPALASRLGIGGRAFAIRHFDLAANTRELAAFYRTVLAQPARTGWAQPSTAAAADTTLLAAQLSHDLRQRPVESSPAWTDLLAIADDLVLECRQLEAITEGGQAPLQALRRQLEQERDDWKRTWELTDSHAKHLASVVDETRAHASNLELTIKEIRFQLAQIEQQRDRIAAQRDVFERQRDEIQGHLRAAQSRASELDRQLATVSTQRDIAQDKVARMSASFSWRATAWLRYLRRRLLDRENRSDPPARLPTPPVDAEFGQIAPAATEEAPAMRFAVDYPHTWAFKPRSLVVRGWAFLAGPEAVKISRIRARVGSRTYPGVHGLKRLDVLAALRDFPQAEYAGFKIDVTLEAGDERITLEAASAEGTFSPFFSQDISVQVGGGVEELTDYQKWIEVFERPTIASSAEASAFLADRSVHPLISVVVPVYNTPEQWLVRAVDSVRAQSYPRWELCLADDASPAPHVRPLLERFAREDPRIKVTFRPANGHISAASNSALEIASGEFTALLDHDDELAPNALFEVVRLLNAHPDTDLIYSDEDKIDEEGRRYEPYFKPDWLPDLFVGQNYVSHLTVYRTAVVRSVGGFRVGYEGSQDWDLALRVTDTLTPDRIRHIPKILYHWRAIPGSTALNLSEKNYPLEAARRALTDHFARLGEPVEISTIAGDHWRIRRPLGPNPPRVSLVIPTRNGLKFLRRCIDSILEKTLYPNFEILVADNGSDDPATLAYLESLHSGKHPGLRAGHQARVLRYDAPFNYSAINNFAVSHARGEVVGLLNNDLEVIHGDWLDEMVSQALRPGIGCVGALLHYPNDTIQHAGVIVGLGGVAGHAFRDFPRGTEGRFNRARLVQNYSAVTAACLVIRKAIYEQVGGLDDKALAVAFNDVDFCLKVRAAGYRNLWTPFAELYHHESATRGAEDTPEKHERFRGEVETMLARWPDEIRHDPAYNPNLTLELTDFTLAAPPRPWSP